MSFMVDLDGKIQKLQIEDILRGKFDDCLLKNSDIIFCLAKVLKISKDIDYWEFGEVYDSEHSCRQEFLYVNKNLLTA